MSADLPDEIGLRLRFIADPAEKYAPPRPKSVRLKMALKRLLRDFGLRNEGWIDLEPHNAAERK